jgi:hypothetical protein
MRSYTSPLTTLELTGATRLQPLLARVHMGTFPVDALSDLHLIGRPRHLVYNTASSNSRGEHWISIWLGKDNSAEIMDSLGHPPTDPRVLDFAWRHANSILYSRRELQHWRSNACGLYCLSHGLARARGESLSSWLDRFGDDTLANDRKVQCEFMRSLATAYSFSPTPTPRRWKQLVKRACESVRTRTRHGTEVQYPVRRRPLLPLGRSTAVRR